MPSPARRLRRWLVRLLLLATCVVAVGALWNSRWAQVPRAMWTLARMPPPTALPVPVDGVTARRIADTFGAPRGRDRTHAGIDIFARRGTPVRSVGDGVVVDVREGGLGGRQVWVLGPARERYYYAHLEGWRDGLVRGEVVAARHGAGLRGRQRQCQGHAAAPALGHLWGRRGLRPAALAACVDARPTHNPGSAAMTLGVR
jgi:hypothetical protein